MGWLRARQNWGVQLALLALVLKLTLAFGHHHFDATGTAHHHGHTSLQDRAVAPPDHAVAHHRTGETHAHAHADDAPCPVQHDGPAEARHDAPVHNSTHEPAQLAQVCFDCLTLAAVSIAAPTPALAQHQVVVLSHYTEDDNTAHLVYHRTAFRSRAPPAFARAA